MRPRFFATQAAFRKWLETHHAKTDELWIGFWKVGSGRRGLTYLEAVEEALCFGWIDGLKKRYDAAAYMHRFTPRRRRSAWTATNVARAEALAEAGRMAPAGIAAFQRRDPKGKR
jgi:uncharacterized protein YdeI (YjbR/CyaY-like superfamily)